MRGKARERRGEGRRGDDTLCTDLARPHEAPHLHAHPLAYDIELADGQPLILHVVPNDQALGDGRDELDAVARLAKPAKEPDLIDPLAVGGEGDGSLQAWRHLVEKVAVAVELIDVARGLRRWGGGPGSAGVGAEVGRREGRVKGGGPRWRGGCGRVGGRAKGV